MNTRERLSRASLTFIALAGWAGIILQFVVTLRAGADAGVSALRSSLLVLSYFTVLTNLLVTVIVSARVARVSARNILSHPGTLAAAAVYILVVGIIYSLLLRTLWAPTGMQKAADVILHDLMPVLYPTWWLVFAPKGGLNWSGPFKWLAYPLAYFTVSLVLGHLTGRYLYPFADVPTLGIATVAGNGVLLLLLFLVLGLIAVAAARMVASGRAHS